MINFYFLKNKKLTNIYKLFVCFFSKKKNKIYNIFRLSYIAEQ